MYCKECGKELLDDAKFCVHCGTAVPTEVRRLFEESKAPFRYKPDPEFQWNTEGFPGDERVKTEDVDFSWDTSDFERRPLAQEQPPLERQGDPTGSPGWSEAAPGLTQDDAFDLPSVGRSPGLAPIDSPPFRGAKEQPTDTIILDRSRIDSIIPMQERSTKEIVLHEAVAEKALSDADAIIEDIKRESAEENARATAEQKKIDKFYTFNKKNEEFQQLLDKQLERIKKGETEAAEEAEALKPIKETETEAASAENQSDALDEILHFEGKLDEELSNLKEDEKPFDTKELNRDLFEIAMEKAGVDVEAIAVDIEPQKAEPELKSDFKPRFMIDAELKESEEPAYGYGILRETEEDETDEDESYVGGGMNLPEASEELKANIDWEKKRALDALWGTMELPPGIAEALGISARTKENADPFGVPHGLSGEQNAESAPLTPFGSMPAGAKEGAQEAASGENENSAYTYGKVDQGDTFAGETSEDSYGDHEEEDDEDEGGLGRGGRIALLVLAILVVLEVLLVGVRVYAPDSAPGLIAANELGFATDWFFALTGFGGTA